MLKLCFKCKIEKDKIYFNKNLKNKDELHSYCKDCSRKHGVLYYTENINRYKRYKKGYVVASHDIRNKYVNDRRKIDPQFRIQCNLRSRLAKILKRNPRLGSAVRDLGCSVDDLKWWLEFWWEDGMSWDSYGNKSGQWSIDHIKPLSKFNLMERTQLLEACNYKNLQPMWHNENMKKSNK